MDMKTIYQKRAWLAAVEIDRMVYCYFENIPRAQKQEIQKIILRHFPHDAPVPEMKGKIPVVLYLENENDVAEIEAAFKSAKPNCEVRQLA